MSKLLNIEMQLSHVELCSSSHRKQNWITQKCEILCRNSEDDTTRPDHQRLGSKKIYNIKNVDPICGMCLLWFWVLFVGMGSANNIKCNKLIIERCFIFMLRNHLARWSSRLQQQTQTFTFTSNIECSNESNNFVSERKLWKWKAHKEIHELTSAWFIETNSILSLN